MSSRKNLRNSYVILLVHAWNIQITLEIQVRVLHNSCHVSKFNNFFVLYCQCCSNPLLFRCFYFLPKCKKKGQIDSNFLAVFMNFTTPFHLIFFSFFITSLNSWHPFICFISFFITSYTIHSCIWILFYYDFN